MRSRSIRPTTACTSGMKLEPEINTDHGQRIQALPHPEVQRQRATAGLRLVKLAESEHAFTLAGIAVDPGLKRVYMLVVDEREKEPDSMCRPRAPSTDSPPNRKAKRWNRWCQRSDKGNRSAGQRDGVQTTGRKAREALLKPGGIAVDPTTHDVIVAGMEDEGNKEELERPLCASTQGASSAIVRSTAPIAFSNASTSGGEPQCGEAGRRTSLAGR